MQELDTTHREYLLAHAITDEWIERAGIFSQDGEIVFPWRDGENVTHQRRPFPGKPGEYYWESGKDLHFWDLADAGPSSPVLVIEGTKQSLAAASHAPAHFSVVGMAGCQGWSKCDLSRFTGRSVYIGLDADAGSNLDVYEAGDLFRQELAFYGVEEDAVRFLRLPAQGKNGLDDVLAKRPETMRTKLIEFLVSKAEKKPADRRPTTRKGAKLETLLPDTGGRPGVAINIDRKEVIDQITGAMVEQHDGTTLFNFGEIITRVSGHETKPLDRDSFLAMLADSVATYHYTEATDRKNATFVPAWPDGQTVGAVMSKAEKFSPLRRVVRVPFLRPDGTVCYAQGYDRETGTVLVASSLNDAHVPDEPTQAEVRDAAKFLMEEWLGDLPFKTAADRANALAMVLTPFIRGVVPLAPLGVVSGLQMGVGKNLFADCLAILATGQPADPLPYVQDEEEMRKMITSAFASGAELFVFDEAHVIQGAQLARSITSLTYNDRILGSTRIAKYPNAVTWMSLGNQVKVNGDLSRRVYFVYLHPTSANVIDREASSFRHPDLKSWTTENRSALVSAALTVIRGWYAAGKPSYSRGATMGSFEPWDRIMSGVLAYAGLPEFLTDVKERRSESDFSTSYWEAHVHWLHEVFDTGSFTTRQVQEEVLKNPGSSETPPGMEDASGKDWTRKLGIAYASHTDRDYNGVRLVKAGRGHKSTIKWTTVTDRDNGRGGPEVDGGNGGDPSPPARENNTPSLDGPQARAHTREGDGGSPPSTSATSTQTDHLFAPGAFDYYAKVLGLEDAVDPDRTTRVGFDLETRSADELFIAEPGAFIRLVGLGGTVASVKNLPDLVIPPGLVGHNIAFFDLLALDRHAGWEVELTVPNARDLRIAAFQNDPPTTYETKVGPGFKSYSLDALGERYLNRLKSDQGKALVKEFGGWNNVPVDDPRYVQYCRDDVALAEELDQVIPWDPYEGREMAVSAITARATLSGFRVDVDGLTARAQELADRSEAGKVMLSEQFGFPTTNKAGKPAAAPQRTAEGKAAFEAALRSTGFPVDAWPRGRDGSLSLSKETMAFALAHAEERFPDALPVIEAVSGMNGIRNNAANVLRYTRSDGRVHPSFEPFQSTGRWSISEPGLTVLKKGVPDSERMFLIADEDDDLVSIDLDQIDIRCVGAHSQDRNLLAILNDPDRDIHSEISTLAFGDALGKHRHYAKSLDLGWLYGRGIKGMVENTPGVTMEAALRVDESMRSQFGRVLDWQNEVRQLGENGVLLDNGFGRRLRVDPERAYTQAPAMMGQSTTRDLIAEGLLDLAKRAPEVLPMLRVIVHDEVVLSVPSKDREEIARIVQSCMSREWAPAGKSDPVRISAGQGKPFVFGKRWGDLYM